MIRHLMMVWMAVPLFASSLEPTERLKASRIASVRTAVQKHNYLADNQTKSENAAFSVEKVFAVVEWVERNPTKYPMLKKGILIRFPARLTRAQDDLKIESVSAEIAAYETQLQRLTPEISRLVVIPAALQQYIDEERLKGNRIKTLQEAIDGLIKIGEKSP